MGRGHHKTKGHVKWDVAQAWSAMVHQCHSPERSRNSGAGAPEATDIYKPLKRWEKWREEMSTPEGSSSLLAATYFSEDTMSFQWIVSLCCCSVAQLCLTLCNPMNISMPGFPVLHYLLELAQIHVHWVTDAIQPSHSLFPPSLPACNLSQHQSFPMSWLFTIGGQSIGASASTSVLPMNIQGWFPLGSTGLIFLLFKGLWRIFSSTTIPKYQFFGAQPSLWSNSHICMWLLEKP